MADIKTAVGKTAAGRCSGVLGGFDSHPSPHAGFRPWLVSFPRSLAGDASRGVRYGGQALVANGSAANLAPSVSASLTEIGGVLGLLVSHCLHLANRLARFLRAHLLRGVGVSKAPAHLELFCDGKEFLRAVGVRMSCCSR